MSVMLMSVSYDTIVNNKHEEQTRYYYVDFQWHSTSANIYLEHAIIPLYLMVLLRQAL